MSQATDQYNAAVRRYEVAEQRIAELEAALRGAREAIRKEISEEWECSSYHPSLTKAVFTIDKLLKD